MHSHVYRPAILLIVVSIAVFACTTTVQEPTGIPFTQAVTVEVPVPITVEVTRIVPQQIIVEATPSPPQACAPATFDDAQEIVIGAVLPLSTSGDILGGFAMQAALSIAVAEINESGGIQGLPVRLVTYDSGGKADVAASAAQKLAREDCAVAITGLLHDTTSLSASERANALNVPLIIAGSTADDVPAQKYPFVFRIAPSDSMLAEMPAKWLAEVGDYNNDGGLFVVSIVDSRQVDSPEIQRLEKKYEEYSIANQTLSVDLPASDFSSVIARIVTMDHIPDAILILVEGDAALELEQQIRTAGIGPQKNTLIVNNESALDSTRFWRIVPNGVGTVVSRIGPWHKTITPMGQTFALKYANYFGHWPEYYAFAAYDSVHLLADALKHSETPSGDNLRQAIADTDAMLASGEYFFPYTAPRSDNEASKPDYLWNQWPDIHTLYLQYDEAGQPSSDMPIVWPESYRSIDGPLSWKPTPTP